MFYFSIETFTPFVSQSTATEIYNALLQPHLNCCSPVWDRKVDYGQHTTDSANQCEAANCCYDYERNQCYKPLWYCKTGNQSKINLWDQSTLDLLILFFVFKGEQHWVRSHSLFSSSWSVYHCNSTPTAPLMFKIIQTFEQPRDKNLMFSLLFNFLMN